MMETCQKGPWYTWAHRWNQINLSETDPRDMDLEFWKTYWRETKFREPPSTVPGPSVIFPARTPINTRLNFWMEKISPESS